MPSVEENEKLAPSGLRSGLASLSTFLLVLWFVFNSSFAIAIALCGAVISLYLSVIFCRRSTVWRGLVPTPHAVYHFIAYTGVFFAELVKANFNMLRYVYSPRVDIRPGVVKVNLRLKSPIGRLALANSIALTPGSLVLDVTDDALFVHWLNVRTTDPEEARAIIAGPFEAHLGEVFG